MDYRSLMMGSAAMMAMWFMSRGGTTEDDKQWAQLRNEFKRQDEAEALQKAYLTVRLDLVSSAVRCENRASELRKLAGALPVRKYAAAL